MAIVLVRGLPGAGKTTLGKRLAQEDWVHLENDQFFEKDGPYLHDPERLSDAIDWCIESVDEAVEAGHNVVVTNVFNQLTFAMPYIGMCIRHDLGSIGILEAKGKYESVRGVPPEIVEIMASRWETYEFPMFTHLDSLEDALEFGTSARRQHRQAKRQP